MQPYGPPGGPGYGAPPPPQQPPPPGYGPPPVKRERPIGVILIAILFLIAGGLNLLGLMNLSNPYASEIWDVAPAIMVMYIINGIIGIIQIIVGIGLLTLKRWARTLAIVFAIIGIIMALASVGVAMAVGGALGGGAAAAALGTIALICASIPILLNVIIIAYLFTGRVKAAFGVT